MVRSESSGSMCGSVSLDEIFRDLDLSTRWTWTAVATRVDTYTVSNGTIQDSLCEVPFHDNTEDVNLVQIRRKIIIRDNPECASG